MRPTLRSKSLRTPSTVRSTSLPSLDSPADEEHEVDSSSIISVGARFSPVRDVDATFDSIVNFLKDRTYPVSVLLASNVRSAKRAFKKKCLLFFLNPTGELFRGRMRGIHRHVLRCGEIKSVTRFVHKSLGHCSVEVCVKVIASVFWSFESLNITAHNEIKHCGCRKNYSNFRNTFSLEMTKYIALSFARKGDGGFTIVLRSTSNSIDLDSFQSTGTSILDEKKVRSINMEPPVLNDGRYRLMSILEMKNVLEKLHVAFSHCAVYNLRALFQKHFIYSGYCAAAYELCSRCWFCKLQGRRKRGLQAKGCDYDVEVIGNINDCSRKFVIKPHVSSQGFTQHKTPERTVQTRKRHLTGLQLLDVTNKHVELPFANETGMMSQGSMSSLIEDGYESSTTKSVSSEGKVKSDDHTRSTNKRRAIKVSIVDVENRPRTRANARSLRYKYAQANQHTTEAVQAENFTGQVFSNLSNLKYSSGLLQSEREVESDVFFDNFVHFHPPDTQFLSDNMGFGYDSVDRNPEFAYTNTTNGNNMASTDPLNLLDISTENLSGFLPSGCTLESFESSNNIYGTLTSQ